MDDIMNTVQIDLFFDQHYPAILAEVAGTAGSGALGRTRAGFASAYRSLTKVEHDGDLPAPGRPEGLGSRPKC